MRPLAAFALVALLTATGAWAGPIAEFNTQMDAAYAVYRQALFDTNSGKVELSTRSVAEFVGRWDGLVVRFGIVPPPHFAEDSRWRSSLDEVTRLAREAQVLVAAGRLPAAHETLEKIRDVLADQRRRNGVIAYSDFMNAFHEHMEHVLGTYKGPIAGEGLGMLREEAAVLRVLWAELKTRTPAAYEGQASFQEALRSVGQVVDRLQRASRDSDGATAVEALKALKPAYAKLFLRWG